MLFLMYENEVPLMTVEIVKCPVCGQSLALSSYLSADTVVVCADCETNLKIRIDRKGLQVQQIPVSETLTASARPESYG
jgi:alpha-aminoadipate carrier protein LysW